jgi:hypothetical protein
MFVITLKIFPILKVIMKGCPGEEGDDDIEQKLLIAEEQRLVETPYLHQEVVRLVDREFIEGKAIRALGNIIKPHPPIKRWNTQYGSTCFTFSHCLNSHIRRKMWNYKFFNFIHKHIMGF